MNIKAIAFLSLLAVSTLSAPAFSQTAEIDISKVPTINNKDWRTPQTFSPPWSTPVLVNDEFDGTYLTVFDHNFQRDWGNNVENGLTTSWSLKTIRAYAYIKTHGGTTIQETSGLIIKVGGKTYPLTGKKGNFTVTPELAYALKTAPLEVAKVKVEFEDSGIPTVSDIGTGTVTAWRTVYQQAKDPQTAGLPSKIDESVADSGEKPKKVDGTVAVSDNKPKVKVKSKRKH
jgi:hypothetical protein